MLDEMAGSLIASLGPSAVFAVAAVLLWFYLLRYLDRRLGIGDFKQVFDVLKSDPRALAGYLRGRALAVAILVGLVLATVRF